MQVKTTSLPGVLVIEPRVHGDERGFFLESYNRRAFAAAGIDAEFVQDNHSKSSRCVLRGLHYQIGQPQGKLVRVLAGRIHDVAVDLRRSSAAFGKWHGVELDAASHRQLWIPPGFAHGFLVLSEVAEVFYKTTDFYAPDNERAIRWNDPDLAIAWPLQGNPIVSPKDASALLLADAETFP